MKMIKSYKQVELAEKEGINRHKISREASSYIPIMINTSQSRVTKRGYGVRYITAKDVEQYLNENHIENKKKNHRK